MAEWAAVAVRTFIAGLLLFYGAGIQHAEVAAHPATEHTTEIIDSVAELQRTGFIAILESIIIATGGATGAGHKPGSGSLLAFGVVVD